MVMFIGLNPSTANEISDDPTIRRVQKFAYDWGYGGVYMLNLFAWISTDPAALLTCTDPVGENDIYLKAIAESASKIIFAWGGFKVNGRDQQVIEMFPDANALVINKDGTPGHPLYVPGNVIPCYYNTSKNI
jgi:hypothetical protein